MSSDMRRIVTVQQAYEHRLWEREGAVLCCPRWERYLSDGNLRRRQKCADTGEVYEPQINPFADYDVVGIRLITRGNDKGRYEVTFSKNAGWADICRGREPFVTLTHDGDWPLRFTDVGSIVDDFLAEWRIA